MQPIRSCRIWCTFLLVALSLAYLPEWAPLFASGPPAVRPGTQHERTTAFDDVAHSIQHPESSVGRALFQEKTGADRSAGNRNGGGTKPRTQTAHRRSGGVQRQDSDGEASAAAGGAAAATCKVPEAVKPRRAGATTVKASAQKCRAACRWVAVLFRRHCPGTDVQDLRTYQYAHQAPGPAVHGAF